MVEGRWTVGWPSSPCRQRRRHRHRRHAAHHIQNQLRLTDRWCSASTAMPGRRQPPARPGGQPDIWPTTRPSALFLPEEHDPTSFVRSEGPDAPRCHEPRPPSPKFSCWPNCATSTWITVEGCPPGNEAALVTRIPPRLRQLGDQDVAEAAGFTLCRGVEQARPDQSSSQPSFDPTPLRRCTAR